QALDFVADVENLINPFHLAPIQDPLRVLSGCPEVAKNHNVLATGYKLDESTHKLAISIYDPNYPDDDGVSISITLQQDDSRLSASHSKNDPMRGFFVWEYDRRQIVVTEAMLKTREHIDEMHWWILME
ncbi:MAG: hypothetical protein MUF59_08815, partial [Candidatus Krumholzibacteria bacterium]|nr:hypothetical protein [Candidatus Krumholzibacteria bacterium]